MMKCLGEQTQDWPLPSSLLAVLGSLLAHWQRQNAVQVVVVGDGDQGTIAGKNYWGRCLRRTLCRHLHPLVLGNHQAKVAEIQSTPWDLG